MTVLARVRSFLSALLRRRRLEREMEQEWQTHLETRVEALRRSGMSRTEAGRRARIEFGDPLRWKEQGREARGLGWIQDLGADVRYALRQMRRAPAFTLVAVFTLALGIGANTAIFSVANAVMFRPLPYPDAERLVRIWESNLELGRPTASVSQPNFLDWHARTSAFSAFAAASGTTLTTTSDQEAEIVNAERVTADFLSVLGVSPAIGRNFRADETRPGGDVRVAIVGDGFWRRRFASDASVLGRQIAFSGVPYTVVGVLPPSFRWATDTVDVLVPLAPSALASRGDRQLDVIGRLKDSVTIERAKDELTGAASALAAQYPESNKGWSVRVAPFYEWLIPAAVRDSLMMLLGTIGVVLIIVCANVANLLIARAAGRQTEFSIRVALGAARWRIIRQLLTESLLLSLGSGVVGVAAALAGTRVLVRYGPASVPRLDETSFDLTVFAFALVVSATTAVAFGMVPALHVARQPQAATLQAAGRGATGSGRQRARSILTVVEVALSVVLLIGAGLLLRSVSRLQQVDPGFDAATTMVARVALPSVTYPNGQARSAFYERLLTEIRTLPGIVASAASSGVPLAGGNFITEVRIPGQPRAGAQASAGWRLVSPGYFAAMGIPLRGRDFTWRDRESLAPATIISETLAREYWPNEDPIGRTITLGTFGNRARTIIGVAGDVRQVGLDTEPRATVYYSAAEVGALAPMSIVWRSAVDPASHVAAVRDVLRRVDSTVPLYGVQSLDALVAGSFAPRKFNMYLLGSFAAVALVLAAVGLFGVTSYLVSQRTREIGLRLALGADRRDIFQLIVGRGIALTAIGAAIGVGAAFWASRVMQSLLFSVSSTDPRTFLTVPAILVVVALVACYIPARRATKIDPLVALRCE